MLDTTYNWRCSFFKARFSSEKKIQAVRQYIDGNEGGKTIAKSIDFHPSLLHQWIKQFELFGLDAFEKRYTPYPAKFNLDVLYYMNEHGASIHEKIRHQVLKYRMKDQ